MNNSTDTPVALARGHFHDGLTVAAVVVVSAYQINSRGLELLPGRRPGVKTDPPSSADRPLWQGTSVTAAGTVLGPGSVPCAARVTLRVGEQAISLRVWGDRCWVKNAGKLVASAPKPWEELPLSWEHAFGGAIDVPPGPFGPSGLPHPGGRIVHPGNPRGKGLCIDERKAEGTELPNIEWEAEPMTRPTDQPRPAGFAPCPELLGLRVPDEEPPPLRDEPVRFLRAALRMAHPAPSELIFPQLAAGTPIEVLGLGQASLRLEIPKCPVRASIRKGRSVTPLPEHIRSVHLSADDTCALVTYAHPFCYEVAPSWVDVQAN